MLSSSTRTIIDMNNDNENNKYFELISNISNIAVQGYDKQRRVTYWNKASESMFGYSFEEVKGKKLEDLIIPDLMRDEVIKNIANYYEKNLDIPSLESALKHKDGSIVYVHSSYQIVGKGTSNPEIFCVSIDLSQQKKQEEELEKKNQLVMKQTNMADLGKMINSITHKWKQPLNVISCLIQALDFKIARKKKEITAEHIKEIHNTVIEQVQELSISIDEFRNFFNPLKSNESISISDMLRSTLSLLKDDLEEKEIRLDTILDDQLELFCSLNEFKPIFINLINNSMDAFIQNETKNKKITIEVFEEEENIVIKLSDNAGGIPLDNIQKIFNIDFTTKNDGKSAGIGLYVITQIVEKYKGTIEVENIVYPYDDEKKLGAQFIIKIAQ